MNLKISIHGRLPGFIAAAMLIARVPLLFALVPFLFALVSGCAGSPQRAQPPADGPLTQRATHSKETTESGKPMPSAAVPATRAGKDELESESDQLPARPEQLEYKPIAFEPPLRTKFEQKLKNGVSVYLLPSHELPLVEVQILFKGGSYLDPDEKTGLTDATASMMRRGGTATLGPSEFDEEVDFLAAEMSVSADSDRCSARLNTLSANFDKGLQLFFDMLRNPGFDANRFEVYGDELIEAMSQRNDRADSILAREWAMLLYGADHFAGKFTTSNSLHAISLDDLRAQHRRIFHPANMVIGVTGDFEPAAMLQKLEGALAGWQAGEKCADPPKPTAELVPGVYHAAKAIPQGKVQIGLRSLHRDHPDFIPLQVLNNILGASSFGSRLGNVVRSEEGLAYQINSRLDAGVWYPGEWMTVYQSKNRSVALAAKLILKEFEKVRAAPVTAKELDDAKSFFIDSFPRSFESKRSTLALFLRDHLTNRPDEYYQTFRDKVRALTPADLQRVAVQYIRPDAMAIMVVGKWDEIEAGDARANMKEFFGGKATALPARDPLTLEAIPETAPATK